MSRQPPVIRPVNVFPGVSHVGSVWRVPPPTMLRVFRIVFSSCSPSERLSILILLPITCKPVYRTKFPDNLFEVPRVCLALLSNWSLDIDPFLFDDSCAARSAVYSDFLASDLHFWIKTTLLNYPSGPASGSFPVPNTRVPQSCHYVSVGSEPEHDRVCVKSFFGYFRIFGIFQSLPSHLVFWSFPLLY